MLNLAVISGKKDIPQEILNFLSDFTILYTGNCDKSYEEDETLYSYSGLRWIVHEKLELEYKSNKIFSKVLYINSDTIELSKFLLLFKYFTEEIEDFCVYSPDFMRVDLGYKEVHMPSPNLWLCSSYTFNILGNIDAKHFKQKLYQPVPSYSELFPKEWWDISNRFPQFFSLTGGFGLKIKGVL